MLTSRLLIAKGKLRQERQAWQIERTQNAHSRSRIQQLSKVSLHSNFSLAFEPEMVLSVAHKDWRSRSVVISILLLAAAT